MNTTQPSLNRLAHVQSGFTLFEVMVAVVVLVIGVLGAAAMTITAIRNSQQSGLRSTGVALAAEASEIMRGNFTQYSTLPIAPYIIASTSSGVGTSLTNTCFTAGTGCSLSQMAQNDLFVWSQKVQTFLPSGQAVICRDSGIPAPASDTPAAPSCNGLGRLVIKIWWAEKNGNGTITAGTAPNLTVPIQPI